MSIARIKITLDDVVPLVTRIVEVPLSIPLADLHLVVQAAMPWWNYHLYEFRAKESRWGELDDDGEDAQLDASKATLEAVLAGTGVKTLSYTYDFGDGWEHRLKIEKIVEAEPGVAYPRLVKAAGRCPPEDVGGPWGYQDYLAALSDPEHESHEEMLSWRGPFDPGTVDRAEIEAGLAALAPRRSRKKPVPRRKTA